jgi:serine/threonine-protein kinase
VLADFGLATALAGAAAGGRLTPANVILGTADYLSPEQVAGRPLDERSDLYALGAVLHELLTGRPPFAGRPPLATLHAHLDEMPPPLPSTVPAAVAAIVARCLRKQAAARYASAGAVATALDAVALA